jgi:hypothetical protein
MYCPVPVPSHFALIFPRDLTSVLGKEPVLTPCSTERLLDDSVADSIPWLLVHFPTLSSSESASYFAILVGIMLGFLQGFPSYSLFMLLLLSMLGLCSMISTCFLLLLQYDDAIFVCSCKCHVCCTFLSKKLCVIVAYK